MHRDECVYVDRFVYNRKDATLGIREAILYAKKNNISKVVFGEGDYYLKEYNTIKTHSIAHDDGCGDIDKKDYHILLDSIDNLSIEGSIDKDGNPNTVLKGYNSKISQTILPSIIWAVNCTNLSIKNISFTREPETATAGVVKQIENDNILVEVFDTLPCYDEMSAYCMNRFDVDTRTLLGESLTYGFGYDNKFKRVGDRELVLNDSKLSSIINVGEGLSWHQSGKTDFQLFFGECINLEFDNVRIFNSNSFAILTERCHNITAKKLILKPKGEQFFTSSRDGWKIYRCGGNIKVIDSHIEGVRMDGQNIHSNFMIVDEIIDDNTVICKCKYAPISLDNNSKVRVYNNSNINESIKTLKSIYEEVYCEYEIEYWKVVDIIKLPTIQSKDESACVVVEGVKNNITKYLIRFKNKISDSLHRGTLITPLCWEPKEYLCINTTFKNIAGAGNLIRCGNVRIENCSYENLMNSGILIGAELDTHCESGHAIDVEISNCTFNNCGFKPRYGKYGYGAIAIKSQGFSESLNREINIKNNIFINCNTALEINDSSDVSVADNVYFNIENKYKINKNSTRNIKILE